jgi:dihydroneopterin aldolase
MSEGPRISKLLNVANLQSETLIISRAASMIEVFLHGLEFYGYHGVPDAEREVGHRYKLDLLMQVDSQAEQTDDVEDSADYGKIGVDLIRFGENQQYRTMERMAQEMGQLVLDAMPKVASLRITIRKMLPPAPFIAEAAGVTLNIHR